MTSGAWLFDQSFRWHDRSNIVQMGFLIFLTLPASLEDLSNEQHSETQKTIERVLDTVSGWQPAGITGRQMGKITECDIDVVRYLFNV